MPPFKQEYEEKSMTFKQTPLQNGGVLVEGTDSVGNSGTTILVSDQWSAYQHMLKHEAASAEFNELAAEFFRPISDAADKARALLYPTTRDWSTVVVSKGTEFEPEVKAHFDLDGTILNILHEGREDLLRWVGNDTLVAVAE
jgi:hypothetical protein